ncbi:MAG: glycosyltransferase family 2 protein [Treponema sp.]|jgi:dolichol-phosphate mannosyltransferase|nr:glycosyltransferase family 2 protein [Treponema sp.]
MNKKLVSIVVSAYNEAENIDELYRRLADTVALLESLSFELIFVNDGSTDATLKKITCLQIGLTSGILPHAPIHNIKIINLNRNFGHEIAMTAGMDNADGDAVIFMDADLQHPPGYIVQMVEEWRHGADIVLTKRIDNEGISGIYKFVSAFFYKILNFLSDVNIPEKTPDFRLLDRKYIDFLKNFNERDRMFRGLLSWIAPSDNKVKVIDFVAPKRFAGKTKYTFSKSLRLAIDAILQFSTRPLRIAIWFGIITAVFSLILGIWVIVEHYILSNPTPGYATTIVAITFVGSVQLIVLGIMGEYIGKIHLEVKKRPLYFAEIINRKIENNEKNNS